MLIPNAAFRIAEAASKDETKMELNGLFVEENGETGKVVATDGKLLLCAEFELMNESEFPSVPGDEPISPNIKLKAGILPLAAVNEIQRNIPAKSKLPVLTRAKVSFFVSDKKNDIAFARAVTTNLETGNVMPIRVVDAQFPQYQNCLPKEEHIKFKIRLSIELLDKLVTTLKKMKASSVVFGFTDSNLNPVAIESKVDGINITGAIMPMKME